MSDSCVENRAPPELGMMLNPDLNLSMVSSFGGYDREDIGTVS